MRLKLSHLADVALLEAYDEVSPADVAVLRAGVTKLLGSGTTKFLIDLTATALLVPAVTAELARLCELVQARQASLVLVGQLAALSAARGSLGTAAPLVRVFSARSAALAALKSEPAPAMNSAEADVALLQAKLAKLQKQNSELASQVGMLTTTDEIRSLKGENARYAALVSQLEGELAELRETRPGAGAKCLADAEKIALLEESLAGYLEL